jgi:hypothetical protein
MTLLSSLCNAINGKKSIEARGWTPLNYYLLTVLPGDRKKGSVDLTCPASDKNVLHLPPLPKLNFSQGVENYYADLIIEEELKNKEGKKQMRRSRASRRQNSKTLSTSTKLQRFHPPNWTPTIIILLMRLSLIWSFR